MAAAKRTRARPPSPLGQALDAVLQTVYGGNVQRFALALGISRSTLYDWLRKPRPRVERIAHRQAIADVLTIDVRAVDALIISGLGYKVAPFRAEAVALAVLASRLDSEDIGALERQAQAMLRRDAAIRRKGRRT